MYTSKGSRDVRLPEYMRTGYKMIGYIDANGNHYPLVLSEVSASGSLSLEAEWQAKDCTVVIVDQNGSRVLDIPVKFHDTVNLKEQCEANGYVTTTWSKAGTPIEDGMLEIDAEGEIIIVAVVESKHGSSKTLYYVLAAMAVVAAVGIGIVVMKSKRKKVGDDEENK